MILTNNRRPSHLTVHEDGLRYPEVFCSLNVIVAHDASLADIHVFCGKTFFFPSLFAGKSSPVKRDETIYSEVKVAGAHTDNT